MKFKKRIYEIINTAEDGDKASRIFDIIIISLIFLSVVSIVLNSFESLAIKYAKAFQFFEAFTAIVFTIEYILRIWTANYLYPESNHPHIKYIFSFFAVVDLLAVLPFYLPFISVDLRFLRMLRLLRTSRLLRLFKLGRYMNSFQMIAIVVRKSASQLLSSIVVCSLLMLLSAILMYTVQNPAQPSAFPDVISSLWWAVCTLTTVGYGDVYPITALGKIFAAVISLLGIGIVAVPTGIISAGFISYMEQKQKKEEQAKEPQKIKKYCPYCGEKLDE